MVDPTEDAETVEVVLKIRKCDSCQREAVSLEGRGVPCPVCHGGELLYTTGDVQTVEMTPEGVENVAESEIQEVKD